MAGADAQRSGPRAAASIVVELCISPGPRQVEIETLHLCPGSTVEQALRASALRQRFAELCAAPGAVWALWGRAVRPEVVLRDGDRLALCRPLQVDPKEARRLRYRAEGLRRHAPRPKVKRRPREEPAAATADPAAD